MIIANNHTAAPALLVALRRRPPKKSTRGLNKLYDTAAQCNQPADAANDEGSFCVVELRVALTKSPWAKCGLCGWHFQGDGF